MSQDNKQVSQKGLNVSVKITLPVAEVGQAYQKHLAKVASQVNLKGFRRSARDLKMKELERTRGAYVRSEAVDQLLQEKLEEVIKAEKHSLAARPEVVNTKGDGVAEDLECQLAYEVFAEFPEVDLAKLKVTSVKAAVSSENVASEITKLQEHHGGWGDVDRASKKGDKLKIDFVGRLDDEIFEGGSATGQEIELGEGKYLPDFEKSLLKRKAGDEVTFPVSFPKDYQSEQLAGKTATFEAKIHTVSEKTPMALGENLYEASGSEAKQKPEFEKEITSRLESDAKKLAQAINRKRLIKVLKDKISLALPEVTVNEEVAALKEKNDSLSDKEANKQATETLRLALILRHYIQELSVKASKDDIKDYIAIGAPEGIDAEMFYDWYAQDQKRLEQVRGAVMEQNVLDAILDKVTVKEVSASINEIEKELQEAA
ncbi:trigger factor [Candidatus Synchoanobacter obligatus]|uniref:Trigger factor n=1 Tax=Candidatus Synchoanobacter obligatus TaxID=2919597 RepID=A0ABT1L5N2_9GAMM|nr:trigger factor [Candidatus Synchoanobacter obligatus]MCP8352457.1 trigger factor [Candidatus Synchoanobacter obligatus]